MKPGLNGTVCIGLTDQVAIPQAMDRLNGYGKDWAIAIASHQHLISEGHKTLTEAKLELLYCVETLEHIPVMAVALSPGSNDCNDVCWQWSAHTNAWVKTLRKAEGITGPFYPPGPGMLERLRQQFAAVFGDLPKTMLYVGNQNSDRDSAIAAGFDYQWDSKWYLDV